MSQPKDPNSPLSAHKIRLIKKKPSDSLTSQKLSGQEKLDIQLPDDAAREANREKNKSLVRSLIASSLMIGTMMSGGLATIVLSPLAYFWLYAENQNLLHRKYRRKLSKEKAESRLTEDFGNQLPEFKHQSYYIFDETQPYTNQTEGIDFFFSPNPEQTMAFRVIDKNSIFSRNEKIQLFYDPKSSRLLYQKLGLFKQKQAPTPFKTNFIQAFASLIQYFQKNPSDLVHHPSINIIVLTGFNQLIIPKNTSTQCLNGRHYLSVNDIYIVEESQFNTLIEDLSANSHTLPDPSAKTLQKPSILPQNLPPPNDKTLDKFNEETSWRRFPSMEKYIASTSLLYYYCFRDRNSSVNLFVLDFFRTQTGKYKTDRLGKLLSLAIKEETEYRIFCLLQEKLFYLEPEIYTRWEYALNNSKDPNIPKMPDIILRTASDTIYMISVKSLISTKEKPIKIFYDCAVDTLRYRKGKRGKQNFYKDPLDECNEQAKWLLENCPTLVPHEPIQILVFANPLDIKLHPETPTRTLAKRKSYIYHKNVYVAKENKLIALIKFLTMREKPQNSS